MGKQRFNSQQYAQSASQRASAGVSSTQYSNTAKSTGNMTIHPSLNPAGKVRVSRDVPERPRKTPIMIFTDVSGSMQDTPTKIQTNLPQLMGLLEYKHYCSDPDILVGAFGNIRSDDAPIQIGSFEGGIELDEQIRSMILEGGGAGGEESPEMPLSFAAYRTKHDHMDKRGKRGYLFFITDEMSEPLDHEKYNQWYVPEEPMKADIPFAKVLEDARKLYDVFFILPPTAAAQAADLQMYWRGLFDTQHFLILEDVDGLSQLIAATIGLMEGSVDWDGIQTDLKAGGTDLRLISQIGKAVKVLPAVAIGAKTVGLPTSKPTGEVKRLQG